MRFRLYPTPAQEVVLLRYCADARYVWNLAVEQQSWWRSGRGGVPGPAARSKQLTEARAAFAWLAATPRVVQEQALRDFDQAMGAFASGARRRPTWRRKGRSEGFRVQSAAFVRWQPVRVISKRWGQVRVPSLGWVRYRRTRDVPVIKSYSVVRDGTGGWYVCFTVRPTPIDPPLTGAIIGLDRGVTLSLATSEGATYACPVPTTAETRRVNSLRTRLNRANRGSNRRAAVKARLAKTIARQADRRKDWIEKTSTEIARNYDLIRVEDLNVSAMTRAGHTAQRRGLNRSILEHGWGKLVTRLEQKAPGRVEKVPAAYTSQRCAECGHTARENRESQAAFRCVACGHTANADVNAARNIAAGYAVTARRGQQSGPLTREPALAS